MKRVLLVDVRLWLFGQYHRQANLSNIFGDIFNACQVNGLDKFTRIYWCYDDKGSKYHKALLPSYKAHRKELRAKQSDAEKERYKQFSKLYDKFSSVTKYFGTNVKINNTEADTLIEVLSKKFSEMDYEVIIGSGDGDFMTMLTDHNLRMLTPKFELLNYNGVIEKKGVTPEILHYAKCLCGDAKDNIHGIKMLGEVKDKDSGKKFKKIVAETGDNIEEIINTLQEYVDAGKGGMALPDYPPENPVTSVRELYDFNHKLNHPFSFSDLTPEDQEKILQDVNTKQTLTDVDDLPYLCYDIIGEHIILEPEILKFYKIS